MRHRLPMEGVEDGLVDGGARVVPRALVRGHVGEEPVGVEVGHRHDRAAREDGREHAAHDAAHVEERHRVAARVGRAEVLAHREGRRARDAVLERVRHDLLLAGGARGEQDEHRVLGAARRGRVLGRARRVERALDAEEAGGLGERLRLEHAQPELLGRPQADLVGHGRAREEEQARAPALLELLDDLLLHRRDVDRHHQHVGEQRERRAHRLGAVGHDDGDALARGDAELAEVDGHLLLDELAQPRVRARRP